MHLNIFYCKFLAVKCVSLIKKKTKFSSYTVLENSDGIGCIVIYEEGIPNVYEEMHKYFAIYSMRRQLAIYDFAPDFSELLYI